ncbi:MAG TPA: hypothetical protein VH914_22470 [Acidimicrobiia bacterium]|jgi:hypothetical protein|nr:hypothetical protein [Acidimicrobiia bacterium]
MADSAPIRPRKKPYRTIIVVAGLLLAVNVIIIAGISQRTNSEGTLPAAIEPNGLLPKAGDVVSPESTIGVNLRNDLQGYLEFDGVPIPLDQQEIQATQGIIQFTPGGDKDLHQFPQGHHRITVVYWPRGQKESDGAGSYSWTFSVGA